MNQELLRTKLRNGENVFIYDEYEDACVALYPAGTDVKTILKRRGSVPKEKPHSSEVVAEILRNGNEVTETEFNNM